MKFTQKTFYVSEEIEEISVNGLGAEKIYEAMKPLIKADQESFWVLGFNTGLKGIYKECLFLGGMDRCSVDPKIIFKRLLMNDCRAFIVVHNHPEGSYIKSKADDDVTKRLLFVSEAMGMRFLDHIIIAEEGYYSYYNDKCII